MVEVIVKFRNGRTKSYRSQHRCDTITFDMCSRKVCMKAFGPEAGTTEWFDPKYIVHRNMLVHKYYKVTITHKPLDGRTKYAKSLPWYTTLIY